MANSSPDGVGSTADAPGVISLVSGVDHGVELLERLDIGDGDQVVAAEPADLPLNTAFLVSPLQAWLAVERVDGEVRTERRPPGGFDSLPGEPEDLGDRGPQVVVADLASGDTAERGERVDVSFQECLGPS